MNDLELHGFDIMITVRALAREGDVVTVLVHRLDPSCVTWTVGMRQPSRVVIDHAIGCSCGVPPLGVTTGERPSTITCPKCQRTSHNPNDIEHRYCGVCGYHDGSLIK